MAIDLGRQVVYTIPGTISTPDKQRILMEQQHMECPNFFWPWFPKRNIGVVINGP